MLLLLSNASWTNDHATTCTSRREGGSSYRDHCPRRSARHLLCQQDHTSMQTDESSYFILRLIFLSLSSFVYFVDFLSSFLLLLDISPFHFPSYSTSLSFPMTIRAPAKGNVPEAISIVIIARASPLSRMEVLLTIERALSIVRPEATGNAQINCTCNHQSEIP